MKKIQLSKETLRTLTRDEAADVAGGKDKQPPPRQGKNDDDTRTPCYTFPVRICVTGRC